MTRWIIIATILIVVCVCRASAQTAAPSFPTKYDVVWTDLLSEPGKNSEGLDTFLNTMPIGNGDLCGNAFAEYSTGSFVVLVSKATAYNEAAELMKVTLTNITVSPNPFQKMKSFEQRMSIVDASVVYKFSYATGPDVTVRVWIESDTNVVATSISSPTGSALGPVTVTVTNENLRPLPISFTPAFECMAYNVTSDVVLAPEDSMLWAYHRNFPEVYVQQSLFQQNILGALRKIPNPLVNLTTGSAVFGGGKCSNAMTTPLHYTEKEHVQGLQSMGSCDQVTIGIAVLSRQTDTVDEWQLAMKTLVNQSRAILQLDKSESLVPKSVPTDTHSKFWRDFWGRSFIDLSSTVDAEAASTVAQKACLARLLWGMQARSPYPIRFNGQLFTANRPPKVDFRDWGGHNWWQNIRLPYYAMLSQGDADLQRTLFDAFMTYLPVAQAKANIYFAQNNSAYFDEYTSIIGTTHSSSYGCNRGGVTTPPIGWAEDRWNHYNWQGGLDLSLMILDNYAYTKNTTMLQYYWPIIEGVLNFYRQKFSNIDSNGHMVIFPTQSVETWQCPGYPADPANCATNDVPTVAGLRAVLTRLVDPSMPSDVVPLTKQDAFKKMLLSVPSYTTMTVDSSVVISPCERCPPSTGNVENAELYVVHPYRLISTAFSDNSTVQLAQRTLQKARFPSDEGWNQNAMDAAMLGMAKEARVYVSRRAGWGSAPGYRFPAFSSHFQDYEPSADHLAVLNNAVSYMLLLPTDDLSLNHGTSTVIFPSFPCEWDVKFKLHGPAGLVIEGEMASGRASVYVTPSSRLSEVVVRECQKTM